MSQPLARIRVTEAHGIRRFLYPLSCVLALPEGIDPDALGWAGTDGQTVPLQTISQPDGQTRLDFALHLAPGETKELTLVTDGQCGPVNDPLRITVADDGSLLNQQERFAIRLNSDGHADEIVYDGVKHLGEPSQARLFYFHASEVLTNKETTTAYSPLTALQSVTGTLHGGQRRTLTNELTACKSWQKQRIRLDRSRTCECYFFQMRLAKSSHPLICDFGLAGGVYLRMPSGPSPQIYIHASRLKSGEVKWRIAQQSEAKAGSLRTDYQGVLPDLASFQAQAWFHVIAAQQSLAVALDALTEYLDDLEINLFGDGTLEVIYSLNHAPDGHPTEVGLCWHYLNDIPPIAAATNPQSILLPPIVEVISE